MKKVLLLMMGCIVSLAVMAQKDVTKFLGIPVDGTVSAMVQKLAAKGFKKVYGFDNVLQGQFNGSDVHVFIGTNNNKVYRIMVSEKTEWDESEVRNRFNTLCNQFDKNPKYFSLSIENQKISEEEKISYEMLVHNKRYQAAFYQKPDTSLISYKEDLSAIIASKYSKEQLENPTEEITRDISNMSVDYAMDKMSKKSVWFMIYSNVGKYSISIYYDNEYNKANGEDL